VLSGVLLPLSVLYGTAVYLRNKAFDLNVLKTEDVHVPVISVGNIVAGGVGKTPLVEYIAGYCKDQGRRVGILSRGYKRSSRGVVVVSDGKTVLVDAGEGGDEPVQMATKLNPAIVVVAERRVEGARAAINLGADVLLLDDGFQHRYLHRDVNILVLDSMVSPREESLLPAGRRREPLAAIKRADIVALSHSSAKVDFALWRSGLKPWLSGGILGFRHRAVGLRQGPNRSEVHLPEGSSKKALAFCGIGRPEGFLDSLGELKIEVSEILRFPDHHCYDDKDFAQIAARRKFHNASFCVTTEKDIARIGWKGTAEQRFLEGQCVYYVPVEAEILEGRSILHDAIDQSLQGRSS
jgi:tetraacyldisaccharide 4'-kinase